LNRETAARLRREDVMAEEARLVETDGGLEPDGEGWFVVNVVDTAWWSGEGFGASCPFEGETRFPQFGINLHVVWPGQPNCMYHGESTQEDFLVLAGECLLLVEGEERPLKAWDFVHCPPWTEHVFVGAGQGPCVILMVGARVEEDALVYPANEMARRHGAGVEVETNNPAEAYAPFPEWSRGRLPADAGLPWQ
jgi:uncharacterized cupin superfamily protein